MSRPLIKIECAFGTTDWSTWADGGTAWTDITDFCKSIEITRGRSFEFDTFPAGRCQIVLNNLDRRFDPDYAESPYSGIDAITPLRITATWAGTEYYLFLGFVTSWADSASEIFNGICTVQALDALSIMGLYPLTGIYDEAQSGARCVEVLDDMGWPASARAIDTGISTIQATELENTKVLDHLLHVAEAEFGAIFISKSGDFVFHDRDKISIGVTIDPYAEFGPDGFPYHGPITVEYSSSQIYNFAEVTIADSDETLERSNTASVTKYGRRPFPGLSNLLLTSTEAADDFAGFVVSNYSSPVPRLSPLMFEMPYSVVGPHKNDVLWAPLLGIELRDFVRVVRPRTVGSPNTYDSNVQEIRYTIKPDSGTFTVNLAVTPAQIFSPWLLGNDIYGILGVTTYLGV